MKGPIPCEPLSGVQRMRSGPGAGTGGMKPMARDGGGEAHQHRGDPLSPTSQVGAAGSPPKPSAPLGGGSRMLGLTPSDGSEQGSPARSRPRAASAEREF